MSENQWKPASFVQHVKNYSYFLVSVSSSRGIFAGRKEEKVSDNLMD